MSALGQAYSNNGLSFRSSFGGDLQAGEVFFASPPTAAQLETAFPNYNTVLSAQEAQETASTKFAAALAGGLAVTWTTSTALNGTYGCASSDQLNITAETTSILLNGTFTNGQSTRNWFTTTGTFASFTLAQFKAFATAIAQYVDAAQTAYAEQAAGQSPTWPSASTTINL